MAFHLIDPERLRVIVHQHHLHRAIGGEVRPPGPEAITGQVGGGCGGYLDHLAEGGEGVCRKRLKGN